MLRLWSNIPVAAVCFLCVLTDCLTGCTSTSVEPYTGSPTRSEVIYVIAGGWHTELGLSIQIINGPLAALKPGSRTHVI